MMRSGKDNLLDMKKIMKNHISLPCLSYIPFSAKLL